MTITYEGNFSWPAPHLPDGYRLIKFFCMVDIRWVTSLALLHRELLNVGME